METTRERLIIVSLASLFLIILSTLTIATPSGPSNINITANETGTEANPMMVNISGGIISKLNVTASTQNPNWKAFVGWIDGKFSLDDSSGSTIYDWSLTSIRGEIYATRNSSTANWTAISCANATQITAEDVALEHIGNDNISSTFTAASNSNTFVVAGTSILTNACSSTHTYVGGVQTAVFEEVILHDNINVIFATVLEEDETGFDASAYDFQMIVPENANETKSLTTAYYLYVELS